MNSTLKDSKKLILVFLALDLFFLFVIFIVAGNLLIKLSFFILIFTILVLYYLLNNSRKTNEKRKKLLNDFLISNSYKSMDNLIEEFGEDYSYIFENFQKKMKLKDKSLEQSREKLISYRNFIEMWAHEIKTPLAFSNLYLYNHKNLIDREVSDKIYFANTNIENYINQILYYARLDSNKKDYKMDNFKLKNLVDIALKNYFPIIAEQEIIIKEKIDEQEVFTDQNTAVFIISQILSNSIKYTNSRIEIYNSGKSLYIGNDGEKVKDQDIAFIFEKSFTGEVDISHKSTGMGLYLAKLYGKDLNIDIEVDENKDKSFVMKLDF